MGFILAASGSAVGLGNIWKFPYITGTNGGGLFVAIYLVCILLVGLPIMMAEIMIGRAAQKQPVGAFEAVSGRKTLWTSVGWMGVLAGFIILSYYIVVAGWAMDYTLKSVTNFTAPIQEQAQIEATRYRASTPVNTMRKSLARRRATREAKSMLNELRSQAPKAAWKAFARFEAEMAARGGHAAWPARESLLSDAALRGHVKRVEGINMVIAEVKKASLAAALAHYEGLTDDEVRNSGETEHRRDKISESMTKTFLSVAEDGWTSSFWALLFMLITIIIVAGGVSNGIERACKVLMPTLLVLIGIMVVYGMFQRGFGDAVSFVFKPDASRLKASGVLEALGHAFFTLSLGMGAMITYGSYQRSKKGLGGTALMITGFDTLVALMACLMIFPITFSYGQEAAAGPGLVFMSMPLAFAEIGAGGMLLAIMFFGLLVFAALTSAISLLEVVASYFIDIRGWSRQKAAWRVGAVIFLFAIPSAFAMDPDFKLEFWESSFGMNFFDTMDHLASNWLLPLGGLFIAIYAGWVMPKKIQNAELEGLAPELIKGWLFLIRIVAPILVIIVLLQKVGILDIDALLG
jgi:NSS family neurotransmitter:Na+ symporter